MTTANHYEKLWNKYGPRLEGVIKKLAEDEGIENVEPVYLDNADDYKYVLESGSGLHISLGLLSDDERNNAVAIELVLSFFDRNNADNCSDYQIIPNNFSPDFSFRLQDEDLFTRKMTLIEHLLADSPYFLEVIEKHNEYWSNHPGAPKP